MMGLKLHPRLSKPSHGSKDHRMKMLLAVIDAKEVDSESLKGTVSTTKATESGSSTKRKETATPPALENEVQAPANSGRRNLVTPTHDIRSPLLSPLARPPMLPSASMVRAQTKHRTAGLKMPPPLPKVTSDGRKTYSLNTVNYNHMPKTITVPKPRPSLTATTAILAQKGKRFNEVAALPRSHKAPGSPSQLHSVCCWGNGHSDLATIVVDILSRDPMAVRRKFQVAKSASCRKRMAKFSPFFGGSPSQQQQRNEPFQFPINLALHHQSQDNPNMQVLEVLTATGPDVLRMQDGRNGDGSLTIALRHHPNNLDIIQLLLKTNPNCIKVTDRRGNTPLHVACFQGSSLDVIEELYQHDPSAIDKANIGGETPWQIIQRNSLQTSNPVAEFLYACSRRREGRMRKPTATTTTTC